MLRYFAYGSNMLTARLVARCPGARPLERAVLPDHALAFSKRAVDGSAKATIRPAPGRSLPGVLFALPAEALPLLDAFEGLGTGYDRQEYALETADGPVTAWSYSALVHAELPAWDWYLGLCLAGRQEHGLPTADLAQVRWAPDPEPDRPTGRDARALLAGAGFSLPALLAGCQPPG